VATLGNEDTPSQCVSNGWDEFCGNSGFHHETKGTNGNTSALKIRAQVHCQENDTGLTACFLQLFGRFDTVKHRHRYIGHNNLGLQSHGGVKQRLAVCDFADDLELRLQKVLGHHCETWMIVSQKDSNFGQLDRPTDARLETGHYETLAHDSS
jgi:hypothetical protein